MRYAAILLTVLSVSTASAQEEDERGLSLMERGAQMLMEGLLREMEPALDDLQGMARDFGPALQSFAEEMGPALRGLLEEVEDWSAYEAPEVLENGDIIIRRKPKALEPEPELEPMPQEQIDI